MAGLGYKLFSAGEVLTAANLQGYGIDQSVMVFSSAAERTTDLAAPSQGMLSFLSDSGTTWQYFELYNASTNPGGAKTAGWYPTGSQAVFYATATRSTVSGTSYAPGSASFTYSELWDQLAWRDASTNPDRIIPKSEGLYRATASVQWGASATGARNGAIQRNSLDLTNFYGTGATIRSFSMTGLAYLNGSTDYFNLASFSQDSGGALTVTVQVLVEYIRPSIV
jgi:hypothetical protein